MDLALSRHLKLVPPKVQSWNTSYKPHVSNVKIENLKFDYSKVQAKININKKTAVAI
jgi:hypothetical protein